jgi:hypothetical protein
MKPFVIIGILLAVVLGTGLLTNSLEDATGVRTLIAAWLTLFIFSFLYGDNPAYKFAEHLYVGIAAGYGAAILFWDTWLPNWYEPLFAPKDGVHDYWLIIPGALGILFFCRFFPKADFMIRWPLAFLVGGYAGAKLTGHAHSDLVIQAGKTMMDVGAAGKMGFWPLLSTIVIVVGVISTLVYFFFSKPHTGVLGATARLGIIFLMVAFGASFGYTVMGRISLLIGRLYFLFNNWLGWIT